ncbi:MAG: NAD(P)H-hydrate dehydratase [bacterium]
MNIKTTLKKVFKKRREDTHKKDYGHILIIAGSKGMSGAGVLASLAALRSGAGLVTLAVPEGIQDVCAVQASEVMTLGLPQDSEGMIRFRALPQVLDFIEKRNIDFVACGPGLGVSAEVLKFISALSKEYTKGILFDADALNNIGLLSKRIGKSGIDIISNRIGGTVITPHLGEMARMFNINKNDIKKNKVELAKNTAHNNGLICVLKGFNTVVTNGKEVYINKTGNPGMATAGSGDVLTGIIAGLAGQCNNIYDASVAAVYVHGLSGDIAAKELGEKSLIASDIIRHLASAIKRQVEYNGD